MYRYIVMLLTIIPIILYAVEIDISGIKTQDSKKRLDSTNAGESILGGVISKGATSVVNSLREYAPSSLMNNCAGIVKRDDSFCYSIKNKDMMNNCAGIVKRDDSFCYSIKNKDMMNNCVGIVKRDDSFCYSIGN